MLAEQLLTFAQDFIAEYQKFEIIGALRSAVVLLQSQPSFGQDRYRNEAAPIQKKCNMILGSSRFETYPAEWKRVISQSGFARFLPGSVARWCGQTGFPNRLRGDSTLFFAENGVDPRASDG